MTRRKRLHFKQVMKELDIEDWYCYNKKGEELGRIVYDKDWKKYTWVQAGEDSTDWIWGTYRMSAGCLREVADKIDELDGVKS